MNYQICAYCNQQVYGAGHNCQGYYSQGQAQAGACQPTQIQMFSEIIQSLARIEAKIDAGSKPVEDK